VIGGKKCIAAIVLAVFLLSAIPISVTDGSEAASEDFIKIYEVNPAGDYEGISLFNYGTSTVNLKGFIITDDDGDNKEGTIQFKSDLTIAPSSRITISKAISEDDWFSNRDNVYAITNTAIFTQVKSNYTLADAGDDIYLYKDGKLLDAVSYGNVTASPGWSGDSLPSVTKSSGKYLLRIGVVDTDTAKDWIVTSFGLTNHPFDPSLKFDAIVTPFIFPDSKGEQIYRTFENAKSEIVISIYQLTNINLVALLCQLESRTGADHVDVRITLEGAVLGADLTSELALMKALVDAGGEVRLINDSVSGNYERYSYFHNKYAVVDDAIVIITSENWTTGNLGSGTGNRGWGAVIESAEYAAYMKDIFENDHSKDYGDVRDLIDYAPGAVAKTNLTYSPPGMQKVQSFTAKVTPILSPDNSYEALKYYMDSATTRIYSEQLDLGSTFTGVSSASPISWMSEAANRGVDARFILDASMPTKDAHIAETEFISATTGVKATTIKKGIGFTTTHNKGIILDDKVWVASVNWTSNSFLNNRETAIVIDSQEVTDFFADYFLIDWNDNKPASTELTVTLGSTDLITTTSNAIFIAHGGSADAKYEWDVLGNGNWVESGTSTIVRQNLPAGSYTLKVRTTDGTLTAEFPYIVASGGSTSGDEEKSSEESPLDIGTTEIGIIAAIIIIIGAAIGGLKVSKGRKGR
jgi:hypothetical protein